MTLKVEAHQQRGVVAWHAKKEKGVESVSSTGEIQMSAQPRSTIERSAVKTDAYLQTLLNSMALSGASGVGSAVSSRLDLENFLEKVYFHCYCVRSVFRLRAIKDVWERFPFLILLRAICRVESFQKNIVILLAWWTQMVLIYFTWGRMDNNTCDSRCSLEMREDQNSIFSRGAVGLG